MSRISIDVTPEEHQRLKAMAALQGKSIKEFVLARTIGEFGNDEADAMRELESILDRRIERARSEGPSKRTVAEISAQARRETEHHPDA